MAVTHQIIAACLDPEGKDTPQRDKSGEYIQLRRVGSLKDHVLKHRVYHPDGRTEYEVYHHFKDDAPIGAELVIVHSGEGHSRMDHGQKTWHTFNGKDKWLLNNKEGEHILLENAQGQLVDQKRFAPHHCEKPVKPKQDSKPVVVPPVAFGPVRR